jgi:hypothetical protein
MKKAPILLFALASLATAHHSFQAEYDQSKPLTLVGKVTKVVIENPHGWIYLEVKKDNGKTVSWQIETPAPGALNRNGSGREAFNELVNTGEQVTVSAFAARDESKHAWGSSITREDGHTTIRLGDLSQPGPGLPR